MARPTDEKRTAPEKLILTDPRKRGYTVLRV